MYRVQITSQVDELFNTKKEEIMKEESGDEFVPQPKLLKLKYLMNSFWPMWGKRQSK